MAMARLDQPAAPRFSRLVTLLFISVWINYVDRGNISVATPAISPELGLGPAQVGILLSSFFWTYSLLQPLGGWLIDRYDPYRVYAGAFALWSLAVAGGGLATGLTGLVLSRLLLGAGECVAYPTYSKVLTENFSEDRRGFANAMVDIGTKAGPALGTFLGGLAIAAWGWRSYFMGMGLLSLMWLWPWYGAIPPRRRQTSHHRAAIPLIEILSRREAWTTFLGLFCFNYAFYFLLTWLPAYLVSERQMPLRIMAVVGALPFAVTAAASLLAGYASDRWIRGGHSVTRTRKGVAVVGLVLCALTLPAVNAPDLTLAMAAMLLAFAAIGFFTSNVWAITQTLAGEAAGSWTGVQNAAGNMGGVVAPIVTGLSVEKTGSFIPAFLIASAMLALASVFYGLVLGPIRPLTWKQRK